VRAARRCVAYTGAGISTAAGINDYASVAAGSHAAAGGGQQARREYS
jgi:NAD-dependent SIR2 family protein deacetylase